MTTSTKCPPDTGSATSEQLAKLWKRFTEVDGTSAEGAKAKEAVKSVYDTLAKASEDISTVVEAYRKVYLQLFDQFVTFERLAGDERYTKPLRPERKDQIDKAVAQYLQRIWEVEKEISTPGWENDLEEQAHKQIVEYEGAKKHPDLVTRWFEMMKGEQKQTEARHKSWTELRDKAEKAFGEQKYERAYFYITLLRQRLERQKKEWGEDKAPITPTKLREELHKRWGWLLTVLGQWLDARLDYDRAISNLDQARKRLEQLNKTGVDEVSRDLDLDAPAEPTSA